jgi:hypothetical protein
LVIENFLASFPLYRGNTNRQDAILLGMATALKPQIESLDPVISHGG